MEKNALIGRYGDKVIAIIISDWEKLNMLYILELTNGRRIPVSKSMYESALKIVELHKNKNNIPYKEKLEKFQKKLSNPNNTYWDKKLIKEYIKTEAPNDWLMQIHTEERKCFNDQKLLTIVDFIRRNEIRSLDKRELFDMEKNNGY